MSIRSRSRKTKIITVYVIAVLMLFFGRQLASQKFLSASEPVENALIFISDSDSIDAGRGSNSVYRIGLDGRGLKRIVGSIPHGDGYLRTTDIDCHALSQALVIASHRRDLNGFHHSLLDGTGLHLDRPAAGNLLSSTRHIAIAPDGINIIVSREKEAEADYSQPRRHGSSDVRFGLVAGDLISREFETIKQATAARSYLSPVFSPSGRLIAYIIERHDGAGSPAYQLAIAAPNGKGEVVIYETTLRISDVAWSPAGDWLALEMNRQIYRLRPDGGDLAKLTDHLGGATSPRWSPAGRMISYASPSTFPGNQQIMIMNADGSNKRRLANIRGVVVNGCWV